MAKDLLRKEVLVPAAVGLAGLAAGKGPQMVRGLTDTLGTKVLDTAKEQMQSKGGIAGKLLARALGGSSGGKTRRLPIQRWTDVAVPVDAAYKAWTSFDDFPKFMHRVQNVESTGRNKLRFHEKIWFGRREWEAQITERRPNDRIVWKTTSGMSHYGVVSFHKLESNLTRVMVSMEFEPNGMIEKMASGLRFVKRAVQADLARFKAHVEMKDARGIEYHGSNGTDNGTDDDSD